MVLTSIIFFRALPVHPDPEIRISGFRDQEPPGDTWRVPIPPKKIILTKIIYGLPLLLLTNFDLALPSGGYSTDPSLFYKILLRDPLVGWVAQKIFSYKSCSPYMILVSIIFFGGIGYLLGAQDAPDLILYHIQIRKSGFPDPDEPGGL